jgi:hypothetical protein
MQNVELRWKHAAGDETVRFAVFPQRLQGKNFLAVLILLRTALPITVKRHQ